MTQLVRRVPHPGNHKYAFPLERDDRRVLGQHPRRAYPKRVPS